MPTLDRETVLLTKEDVAAIRKLRDMTKDDPAGYPGIMALKNDEAFPEEFGSKREGGAVKKDGEYWYNKEKSTRFVRTKVRYFEGSSIFPKGIVVGTTDIETHSTEGGAAWEHRNSQEDISPEEFKRLSCLVEGIPYFSQRSHLARVKERQQEKKALVAQAKDPLASAARAGAEAAMAVMDRQSKAVAK